MSAELASAQIGERVSVIRRLSERWHDDPEAFVLQSYRQDPEGRPPMVDAPQRKILEAVARHDRVVVRSSHGIGKTTAATWLTHWWLATRYPALVVTLAGTWNHLEDKLWPQINAWARDWRLRDAFEWQTMGIYHKSAPESWRAEASSSDKSAHVEGWHSPNLLVLIDEAKAMPDELYDAIRGALTQVSDAGAKPKIAVFSTPPLTKAGWYCDLFGTKSHGWTTLHISAHESPRVSKDWIAEMAQDYGVDSAVYQSKVEGEIPEGASEVVVEGRWITAAQVREPVKDRRPVIVTCDVAREGEDLTVIGLFKNSKAHIVRWKAKNDTMEAAGMCLAEVNIHNAKVLCLDDTGVGGGVTDRLLELQREGQFPKDCTIHPKKFGAAAMRDDRFANAKSEMWWALRNAMKNGTLAIQNEHELAALRIPRASNLIAQLSAPIYEEDSRSRVRVLDKRDSGERREKVRALPTKSPDLAHALILGAWDWTHAYDVEVEEYMNTTAEVLKHAIQQNMATKGRPTMRPAASPGGRLAAYRRRRQT